MEEFDDDEDENLLLAAMEVDNEMKEEKIKSEATEVKDDINILEESKEHFSMV